MLHSDLLIVSWNRTEIRLTFRIFSVGGILFVTTNSQLGFIVYAQTSIVSVVLWSLEKMLQAAIKMFLTKTHTNNESSENLSVNNICKTGKNVDQRIIRSWEFVYQRNDFYECVRRKNSSEKTSSVYKRKRVKSCPDYMDLRKLSKSLELAIIELKEICEEGTYIYYRSSIVEFLIGLN